MKKVISIAPGRVCLFGDHQDYLGFPVIAAVIDRFIKIEASLNSSNYIDIHLIDINEFKKIDLSKIDEEMNERDYFISSIRVLKKNGIEFANGCTVHISGSIPINAGASSSSALVVAWLNLLVNLYSEQTFTPIEIANLAYKAEVSEHGEPGGMMDQFSISCGNISYITGQVPFTSECIGKSLDGLILANSGEPKDTIGLLSEVKSKQMKAIEIVKQSYSNFDQHQCSDDSILNLSGCLDEEQKPYFVAAIKNHNITKKALSEFKSNCSLETLGHLMNEHHSLLKNNLKITTPKIDTIIETALDSGALGAKINGSGGGGTVVILAPGKENSVIDALNKIGIETFSINISEGAKVD